MIRQILCAIVVTALCALPTSGRKQVHRDDVDIHTQYHSAASPIIYDYLGNCYGTSFSFRGRCVAYNQCPSAVLNWQYYHQMPFNCYYRGTENFICCPEAYVTTTTAAIQKPLFYPSPTNPFLPSGYGNYDTQEQRISEQECSSIYQQKSKSKRRHRSKRSETNTTANGIQPSITEEEATSEPVEEEVIVKKKLDDIEIVGGSQTYQNEFPYMCALGWRKSSSKHADTSYNCGCVLIARKYVITAAHCATIGGESPSVVRLGGVDLEERHAEIIKIKRITQHPNYDSNMAYNDIAVVKMEKSSREQPACLWSNEGLPQQILTALGYGQTKFAGPSSNSLLKVQLSVLTNENCNSYYKSGDKLAHGIDAGQICAGDAQGKRDTCQGDSGGPLLMYVAKYNTYVPYIVGLTSFGEGCATGVPSIYTRISNFIEWIEEEVWN
ncbi:serine protease snake [Stomoxys calcitrans]|uniref:serine protease snake n=1 Tax=Stomoxys calcitrans TaxID=35570 RepID=UPI0027E34DB1|nr:serine protease snake [Stomoxys calcitrans]